MSEKDLVAASSTPSVLAVLSSGESYGYAILNRVREVSAGERTWADGMLYPLLHRLHRLGYVTQVWRTAPDGRRRRYYAITDEGREALAAYKRQWAAGTRALGGALGEDVLPFTLADQAGGRSGVLPTDRGRGRAGRGFGHFGPPGTPSTPSCRRPRGPDGWIGQLEWQIAGCREFAQGTVAVDGGDTWASAEAVLVIPGGCPKAPTNPERCTRMRLKRSGTPRGVRIAASVVLDK